MSGQFPFPQTLGRQRDLNTVASDPNTGLVARPTQTEGTSLFTQVGDYVNNWLGDIGKSNKVKDDESLNKAGKVSSGQPATFETIADKVFSSSTFKTYGDRLLGELGYGPSRVDPGAKVPGRPPAPETTHYQYPNLIDKSIADIRQLGQGFVDQVKGYFNVAYEGPVEPQAIEASSIGGIGAAGGAPFLVVLAIIFLVLK